LGGQGSIGGGESSMTEERGGLINVARAKQAASRGEAAILVVTSNVERRGG